MRGAVSWFNTVLAVLLLGFLTLSADAADKGGKKSKEKKPKLLKSIRVYVENRHDLPERSLAATIGREDPIRFSVDKLPILSEDHVSGAAMIDQIGGFQVQIKFNSLGSKILESYSAAAAGRHLAILVDIDGQARWIAAPLLSRRIGNGTLTFTPYATQDEMLRLVEGLNELVEKKRKQWLND